MREKILSAVVFVGFAFCGCGVDSIFEGGLVEWLVAAGITVICGYFLFCHKDRTQPMDMKGVEKWKEQ